MSHREEISDAGSVVESPQTVMFAALAAFNPLMLSSKTTHSETGTWKLVAAWR